MSHDLKQAARVDLSALARTGLVAGAAGLAGASAQAEVVSFVLNENVEFGETFVLPGISSISFSHRNAPNLVGGTKVNITANAPSALGYNDAGTWLEPGVVIGPGFSWTGFVGYFMASEPPRSAFLAFSFESEPQVTRYGWIEISASPAPAQFVVKGFAYETTPGLSITTPVPEPGSLALLAAGTLVVAGAAARRRRSIRTAGH